MLRAVSCWGAHGLERIWVVDHWVGGQAVDIKGSVLGMSMCS